MCPRFADIQDCPLYHGMHEPGPSCYDAEGLPFGKCAVALGKISYEETYARLLVRNPRLVFECEATAMMRRPTARPEHVH